MAAEMETGAVLSVVLNIVLVVAFFILVSRAGSILKELKKINLLKQAEMDGTIKQINCPICKKQFKTAEKRSVKCPHCGTPLHLDEKKADTE